MDPEVKAKWITALRSGLLPQGRSALVVVDRESEALGYCCWGVLSACAVEEGVIPEPVKDGDYLAFGEVEAKFYPPIEVLRWAGIEVHQDYTPDKYTMYVPDVVSALARLNDQGESFDVIANQIEEVY